MRFVLSGPESDFVLSQDFNDLEESYWFTIFVLVSPALRA